MATLYPCVINRPVSNSIFKAKALPPRAREGDLSEKEHQPYYVTTRQGLFPKRLGSAISAMFFQLDGRQLLTPSLPPIEDAFTSASPAPRIWIWKLLRCWLEKLLNLLEKETCSCLSFFASNNRMEGQTEGRSFTGLFFTQHTQLSLLNRLLPFPLLFSFLFRLVL